MPGLQDLMAAQSRVYDLRQRESSTASREIVVAMNRLMSLLRHATSSEVAAFDAWRREEEQRRGLAS